MLTTHPPHHPNWKSTDSVSQAIQSLIDALPDIAVIISPDGRVSNVNRTFSERSGLTSDDCLGQSINDIIAESLALPAIADRLQDTCSIVLSSQKSMTFEDETDFLKVSVNPVISTTGEVAGIFLLLQDITEQRQRELQWKKKKELKQLLLDEIPSSAVIFDSNLALVASNRTADELLSRTESAENGQDKAWNFFKPEEIEQLKAKSLETLRTGNECYCEVEIQPRNQLETSWMMTRSKRIVIDGEPYLVTTGFDITERKKIEQLLEANQHKLSLVLQAAHAGVIEWDPATGTIDWSEMVWELLGLHEGHNQPSIGLWEQVVLPEDHARCLQIVNRAAERRENFELEYRARLGDGSIRWLFSRGMARPDDCSTPPHYIGIIVDVTERKKQEIEQQRFHTTINQALAASNIGVWVKNLTNSTVVWSDSLWKLFGIDKDDQKLTIRLWTSFIHPDDRARAISATNEAIARGTELDIEYRICHPDGSVHWLMCRGNPLVEPDGNSSRYVGSVIDITMRKKLETELIENKIRLGQALEAARAGVWEWNLETNENIWSDEIWTIYGLEHKKSQAASFDLWASSIHPEDLQRAIRVVTEAAANQTELNAEYRVCHPDGSVHWMMSRGKPVLDDQGRAIRYIGTIIDITDRRNTEEKLRKSQEKLDFFLSKSNIGAWEANLDDLTAECSLELVRIFGDTDTSKRWSLEQFLSHVVPADLPGVRNLIFETLGEQKSNSFECRIRTVDGHERWIWVLGVFNSTEAGKGSRHAIGILQDITERKSTELLMQENEKKFREIFDHSPIAIVITTLEGGNLFDANTAWLRLFDYTKEEVLGRTSAELGLFTRSEDEERFAKTVTGKDGLISRPFQMRSKTGKPLIVLVSSALITINNRAHLLIMTTDVTIQELQQENIAQLEGIIQERTRQLRMEVARLQQFLSMISHEYRTPLAIIRGSLDLINLKFQNADYSFDREISKIKRAIDRLIEVLEVSIDESRLLESPSSSPVETFELETVITSQIEAIVSMWPEKEIWSTGDLDDAIVYGEAAQLKVALFNLLDNARKYSPSETAIEIERYQEEDDAVIVIRNHGNTITMVEEIQLFEKYYRGSNTANTSGAGIGLWLVKKIVEQHQGSVSLRGSCAGVEAVIRLPLFDKSPVAD